MSCGSLLHAATAVFFQLVPIPWRARSASSPTPISRSFCTHSCPSTLCLGQFGVPTRGRGTATRLVVVSFNYHSFFSSRLPAPCPFPRPTAVSASQRSRCFGRRWALGACRRSFFFLAAVASFWALQAEACLEALFSSPPIRLAVFSALGALEASRHTPPVAVFAAPRVLACLSRACAAC